MRACALTLHPYVEAHPEEEGQRAPQEGQPRPQAQPGPQLLSQLLSVRLGDSPESWAALGFTVDGASGSGTVLLANTLVELTGSGAGFEGWSIEGLADEADVDGLALLGPPQSSDPDPTPHANGIGSIDHIVISTGDVEHTVGVLEALGLERRGGRSTDSYGSPMRQVFFWLGDVILELVGPDEGEPTTQGPARFFGLALVSEDLDATAETMGELCSTPRDAVQPGRRIAGIRGRQTGVSAPLAVMSPHPTGGEPRP